MKRLLFISILLTTAIFSRLTAQDFPTGEAEWLIYKKGEVFDEAYEELYVTKMIGDTMINQMHYNVIEENRISYDDFLLLLNTGFVRNEGDKVFRLDEESMEEVLIYDFGLEQGDVFNTWYYVLSVDSIQMEDDTYRKRWQLGTLDSTTPLVWIAGIGNKHAILNSTYFPNMVHKQIVCFKEEGEIIYSNSKVSDITDNVYDCDNLLDVNNEVVNKMKLSLSPNPSTTYFNISFANKTSKIESIIVYDLMGNLLFKSDYNQETSVKINTTTWVNGLYFVKINGRFVERILIQ